MLSRTPTPVGPDTHGVKYIGSKRELLPHIVAIATEIGAESAIDVFSGTTRVAQALRQNGIRTTTSDLAWATSCYAQTFVHNQNNAHLANYISKMNALTPVAGWLTENYTGEGPEDAPKADGRCFRRKNTMKADAARDWIDTLELAPWEKATLITSVIRALDSVDNTVGVQQAYLKSWCARSIRDLVFELPPCIDGPTSVHHEGDALKIKYASADLAYVDPPYSPHSYACYYHIWDSIARWDKPRTGLKARRRADRISGDIDYNTSMESPWNKRNEALLAFDQLLGRLPTKNILVSYSDESLVDREGLISTCERHGSVTVNEVDHRRNVMSRIGNAAVRPRINDGSGTTELLILIEKN